MILFFYIFFIKKTKISKSRLFYKKQSSKNSILSIPILCKHLRRLHYFIQPPQYFCKKPTLLRRLQDTLRTDDGFSLFRRCFHCIFLKFLIILLPSPPLIESFSPIFSLTKLSFCYAPLPFNYRFLHQFGGLSPKNNRIFYQPQ